MKDLVAKKAGAEGSKEEDERHTREKDFKPVFLKGLFRCVTFPTAGIVYLLLLYDPVLPPLR
jgi:hypothetical protein